MSHVLVVGAGVAGLTVAHALAPDAGVIVLDKADRPGGRVAAREQRGTRLATGPTRTRLGADDASARMLAGWGATVEGGVATFADPWALTDRAAADVAVERGLVTAVRGDGSGASVELEASRSRPADAVVVTAPVPQALGLLSRGGLPTPADADRVRYHPQDVLLVTLSRPVELPAARLPFARWHAGDGRDDRATATVVAHADVATMPASSDQDATTVQAVLLAALVAHLGDVEVRSSTLKRWRYAAVASGADVSGGAGCLRVPGAPVWLAGDGVAAAPGPADAGVAAAVRSGLATAAAVRRHLRGEVA